MTRCHPYRGVGSAGNPRCWTSTCRVRSTACGRQGAQAIAINGVRLTSVTAIRTAGEAILVDYRPLEPPYRIDAVGPADLCRPLPAESQAGDDLAQLGDYGIQSEVTAAGRGDGAGIDGESAEPGRGCEGWRLDDRADRSDRGVILGSCSHPRCPPGWTPICRWRSSRVSTRCRRHPFDAGRQLLGQGVRGVVPGQRRRGLHPGLAR